MKQTARALVVLSGFGFMNEVLGGIARDFASILGVSEIKAFDYSACSTINEALDQLDSCVDAETWLLGWSLGALIGFGSAAHHSPRVAGMLNVCGTPKFASDDNWTGIDMDSLESIRETYRRDLHSSTGQFYKKFGGLAAFPESRRNLDQFFLPVSASGCSLLEELIHSDLRDVFSQIDCPILNLFGARDAIVPATVSDQLSQLNPNSKSHVIPGAGHMPFRSNMGEVNAKVSSWVGGL